MELIKSNREVRQIDWLTIVLTEKEIRKYAFAVANIVVDSSIFFNVQINDVEGFVNMDYTKNTEEVIFQFETNGFSENGGLLDFEMVIQKTYNTKDFSYFVVGQLVYLLLPPEILEGKNQVEGKKEQ